MTFKEKYGPVALVAGASEGMGAAFAHALGREGLNLVLVARRKEILEATAKELSNLYPIEIWTVSCDLATSDALEQIRAVIGEIAINFLVYNAALSHIGPFLDLAVPDQIRMVQVNMITPLNLLYQLGGQMVRAGRGGIVLMSSLAGNQGSGFLATYAATKAFNRILAEGLWYEWKNKGVDVIGCCAGATITPNYIRSNPKKMGFLAPRPQLPKAVVDECFSKIGKTPSFVSGRSNRVASFFMKSVFSLKKAINIMGDTTKSMYEIKY